MMDQHLTDAQIEQYRSRKGSPDELIKANEHIDQCDECYQRFNPSTDIWVVIASFTAACTAHDFAFSEHLLYDEISSYVDGALSGDQVERARAHVDACRECREDIEYLADLKIRRQNPVVDSGRAPLVSGEERMPKPRLEWAASFLGIPVYRFAQALCLLAIGAAASWLAASGMRRENSGLRARIQELRRDNDALARKAADLETPGNRQADGPPTESGSARSMPVAELKDGDTLLELYKDGTIRGLPPAAASYQEMLRAALLTGRIGVRILPRVNLGREHTLLGESGKRGFQVLSPKAQAVESSRPTLSWAEVPGAATYTVFIRDLQSGADFKSPPIAATRWTPGEHLVRGHRYAWMVEAERAGELLRAPAPDKPYAQFEVVDLKEAEEISSARTSWKTSHLLLGLVYARAGLRSEAVGEFKALLEANPGSGPARRLYDNVSRK